MPNDTTTMTSGVDQHSAALAGRIARFRQRVRNTPRGVMPGYPELLNQAAPAAIAILFDSAEPHYGAGGHGVLLHRAGSPTFFRLPAGAWSLPGTKIRGRDIVSMVMLAFDIDAVDALTLVNVALNEAAARGMTGDALQAEVSA